MAIRNMSSAEMQETIGSIKRMVMIAALVGVLGYSLLVLAGIEQLHDSSRTTGTRYRSCRTVRQHS